MSALTPERIKELYSKFTEISPWKSWHQSFLSDVQSISSMTDDEFLTPESQEKLWRTRGVSGIGPGEAVNVKGAYVDKDIANQLLQIRNKEWPDDVRKRAKGFQDAFDQVMGAVNKKYTTQRPYAKLSRLFTSLFPAEFHTCFTWKSRKQVQEQILGSQDYEFAEGAVLIRGRLREILGEEKDVDETVWRAMFCWWIYENCDAVKRGDQILDASPVKSPDDDTAEVIDLLDIWPASKQRKGLQAITGYLESLRMVISAARGGATPEDIVETMSGFDEFSGYSAKSCRIVFNLVRTFGFLENKDGIWFPSDEGEQLVDDDPADVLVEKLLVRVYGMAHMLRAVADTQPVSRKSLFEFTRSLWSGWTSDFMPSAMVSWMRSLGMLATDENGNYVLTDYGYYWSRKLPKKGDIPVPIAQVVDETDFYKTDSQAESKSSIFDPIPFETVWQGFQQDEELKKFVFSEQQVQTLHLAWHCNPIKRFVLLSGLSGTGKTALLFHYARIYCKLKELESDRHCSIVPVSPDWRDPSGLLGYFNALHADPTFQAEPALRTVIAAAKNPGCPYFLILDEMNLARVERYFAPFLSSMETGEDLVLHAHDDTVNGVPPRIPWPENLFVGGTVNMDETTHPFSDKVLDRAFTMEFWDVQLEAFFAERASGNGGFQHQDVEDLLVKVNDELFTIRRHFGYRTAKEVLDFLDSANGVPNMDARKLWGVADQAFFSKILPKLRGEETPAMFSALKKIQILCSEKGMAKCVEKLERMQNQLKTTGVMRFWS